MGWFSGLRRFFKPQPAAPGFREFRALKAKYDAAQTTDENRRHWANTDSLSSSAANSPDIRKRLRERSRYETSNAPYLRGITRTYVNDLIGTGPRLQMNTGSPEIDSAIESAWQEWADAAGLREKLSVTALAELESGEGFLVVHNDPSIRNMVKIGLRELETDRLDPVNFGDDDSIEYDANGHPTLYRVRNSHPGDTGGAFGDDRQAIPAADMIHWFRKDRPEQLRGVPVLTASLPLFAQFRRYTAATVSAAEMAALFAVILKSNFSADTGEVVEGTAFETQELNRGMMTTLPAGYEAQQMKPEHPATTYSMFKGELLNEAARPLNMPFNVAACNSSSYNYSSGRLDHQTYHRALKVDRRRCEQLVLGRIYDQWFAIARLTFGLLPRLEAVSNLAPRWFWDGFDHVDPVKEASADEVNLRIGGMTYAELYAAKGQDWEEQFEQRAREMKRMAGLGLTMPGMAPAKPAAEPAAPEDETEDEPQPAEAE